MNKKYILIIILIIIVFGVYFLFQNLKNKQGQNKEPEVTPKTYEIQGMKVEILKEGTGVEAKNGDKVTVHYVGTLEDGTKFDSSIDRGTPFSFKLGAGEVITGWDLGVLGMKVGEKRKLTIPYDLAYGENGYGPIPAKATLIFEVELLGINN
jgi:FKBP-type peptidyl-prolyl cis-trans isomerase